MQFPPILAKIEKKCRRKIKNLKCPPIFLCISMPPTAKIKHEKLSECPLPARFALGQGGKEQTLAALSSIFRGAALIPRKSSCEVHSTLCHLASNTSSRALCLKRVPRWEKQRIMQGYEKSAAKYHEPESH